VATAVVARYLVQGYETAATIPGYSFKNGFMEIHNCDGVRDTNAESMCPTLYCWKAIYEKGGLQAKFKLQAVGGRYFGKDKAFILSGTIKYLDVQENNLPKHYRCTMEGDTVLSLQLLNAERWKELTESGEFWRI